MQVESSNSESNAATTTTQPTCKRYAIKDLVDDIDFGQLPDGWIQLCHVSGLKVYFHRSSRVVTTTRPYHLGRGNVRYHRIPFSAIPCLAYKNSRKSPKSVSTELQVNLSTDQNQLSVESENLLQFKCEPTISPSSNPQSFVPIKSPCPALNEDAGAWSEATVSMLDREEGELSSEEEDEEEEEEEAGESTTTNMAEVDDSAAPEQTEDEPPSKKCLTKHNEAASVGVSVVTVKPGFLAGRRRGRRRGVPSRILAARPATTTTTQNSVCPSSPSESPTTNADANLSQVGDKTKQCLFSQEEIRTYCKSLFEVNVQEFTPQRKNRRDELSANTAKSVSEDHSLPMQGEETKVIHYQVAPVEGDTTRQKEGVINMTGKSSVCILHEYCQNVLRHHPTYETQFLENDHNPYQLTVIIDGTAYGTGVGPNKKQARLEAAHKALSKIIPDFAKLISSDETTSVGGTPRVATERDIHLFDDVQLTDPTVFERSIRWSLPTPYNLLVECLNRSCVPETDLKSSITSHGRSKHFFIMELRDKTVKVVCKNKREGRHLAAQHLLAQLHPDVQFWSELLRIYGPGSKPDKRGELESIQSSQTQEKAAVKTSLIRLLKCKMHELADQWEKTGGNLHPKGKFFVNPDNLPVVTFHPDSKTNLYGSIPVPSPPQSSPLPETTNTD